MSSRFGLYWFSVQKLSSFFLLLVTSLVHFCSRFTKSVFPLSFYGKLKSYKSKHCKHTCKIKIMELYRQTHIWSRHYPGCPWQKIRKTWRHIDCNALNHLSNYLFSRPRKSNLQTTTSSFWENYIFVVADKLMHEPYTTSLQLKWLEINQNNMAWQWIVDIFY